MSGTGKSAPRALDRLSDLSMATAGTALVVMALVQFWQVFARYVLNDSPGWTEPVALLFMSLAVMSAAAVAVRRETHFAFLTLRDEMPRPLSGAAKILSRLIAAGTGGALMLMGGRLMIDDWSVPLAGAPLPSGLKFVGLTIGGALMLIFAVERLLKGDFGPERKD